MNAKRRKRLKTIVNSLWEMEAFLDQVCEQLQDIIDEEQAALDAIPEGLQESERAHEMEDYIDTMSLVLADLSGVLDGPAEELAEICENE